MKAIVYENYGPPEVLQMKNVPKPVPRSNEVLIKIYYSSVSAGDWRLRKADPFAARLFNGLFRPRKFNILGFELSGEIESVGEDVVQYKAGDEVFAFTGFRFGAYAEYRCMRIPTQDEENNFGEKLIARHGILALKPKNLPFKESAALPCGALTAQAFLRKGNLKSGENILICGASGSVGTYAVQLAKHYNAKVTALCSQGNIQLVKSLGADRVIDYKKDDITQTKNPYGLIFDASGKFKASVFKKSLNKNGKFLSVKGSAKLLPGDLKKIRELAESGIIKPIVDKTYNFDQVVEAHKYVETEHKRGNVLMEITKI